MIFNCNGHSLKVFNQRHEVVLFMLLHKITLALVWTNRLLQLCRGEMIVSWIGVVAVEWVRRSGLFWSKMLQSEGSRGIKDEPGFWPE